MKPTLKHEMNEYKIPEINVGMLFAKIEKLNKRADKLGMPHLECNITGKDTKGRRRMVTLEITGEVPVIDGWRMLAAVEHEGDVNLIRTLIGVDTFENFEYYHNREPYCDHCKTKKVKKNSYIIQNIESGEMMQVSKTCLKDFFDRDINGYVGLCSSVLELITELDDEDGELYESSPQSWYYPFDEALAVAFSSTRQVGYKNRDHDNPTREAIAYYYFGKDAEIREALEPTEEDWEKAREAIEMIKEQPVTHNSFITMLKDLVTMEEVKSKYFGYVAGAVPFYMKEMERRVDRADTVNEYVGKEKERLELTLTLVSKRALDTFYGITHIHTFQDAEKRTLVWFASNDSKFPMNEAIKVKATVKGHEEYKGVKQTKLNRVTLQK